MSDNGKPKQIKTTADLTPDPGNANLGTERGLRMLDDSLREDGAGRSILVDADGMTIAGNKTLERAADLGLPIKVVQTDGRELVVVQRTDLDLDGEGDAQVRARRMAYRDNRASQVGLDWNVDQLVKDAQAGFDFSAMFQDFELEDIVGDALKGEPPEDPGAQIDRAAELQEKWGTALGQVWELGAGTLYCGSAQDAQIECDTLVFDPPFEWSAADYENGLSWVSYYTALVMGRKNCFALAEKPDFWHWWIWDAGMNRFGFRNDNPVTGCMMVLAFGQHNWNESAGIAVLDKYGIDHFEWPIQVVHIQDNLKQARDGHPFCKPLELAEYMIALYSKPRQVIGDPFAGSGTFLIAAHRLNRRYLGAEVEPKYVAVTLERFWQMFDVEPKLQR